jgi:hypothetical protein
VVALLAGHPSRPLLDKIRATGAVAVVRSVSAKSKKSKSQDKTWSVLSMAFPNSGVPRQLDNRDYRICQEVDYGSVLATSATLFAGNAVYFQLSAVVNYASFAAVFDQYRIDEVEVWLSGSLADPASFVTVIDYDDATAPTTEAALLNYQNAIVSTLNDGHYRRFRPHVAIAAYSGAFASFANEVAPWIDVVSPNVQHYGVKLGTNPTAAISTVTMRARLWLSFRNVR